MHGAPFGEISWQSAPGAASALQIENGTKDIVQVHLAWRCAFTGLFPKEGEGGANCVRLISLGLAFLFLLIVYSRNYGHILRLI